MIIYGRNAIRESIKALNLQTLFVDKKHEDDEICELARKAGAEVCFRDENELAKLAKNPAHQGFVASVKDVNLLSLDELILKAKESTYPLILMLDGIEDPHNLGAILRSADAFGVDGIIIKKNGEAPLNSTVAKVSTGAYNWVRICQVANLNQAIDKLKKNGYWVIGSDGSAKASYDQVDYKMPTVLVVGSEGFGISRLVLKNCDVIVKIPMVGHVNSFNASVSAAILTSQIVLSRRQ